MPTAKTSKSSDSKKSNSKTVKLTKSKNTKTFKSTKTSNSTKSVTQVEVAPLDSDFLENVTYSSFRRLALRANIARISSQSFGAVKTQIGRSLEIIVKAALLHTQYHNRTTVSSDDVRDAFLSLGIPLIVGVNVNSKSTFKTCSSSRKKKVGKTRRSKSGTETKRNIAFQQKNSDQFAIPRLNFSRLVRATVKKLGPDSSPEDTVFRFGNNSVDLLQFAIEDFIITTLNLTNQITLHCGRTTFGESDLYKTMSVMSNPLL